MLDNEDTSGADFFLLVSLRFYGIGICSFFSYCFKSLPHGQDLGEAVVMDAFPLLLLVVGIYFFYQTKYF
jgi:hypothetical protein